MAVESHAFVIGDTPVLIATEKTRVLVTTVTSGLAYLGGSAVTPATGFPVPVHPVHLALTLVRGEFLYAIKHSAIADQPELRVLVQD